MGQTLKRLQSGTNIIINSENKSYFMKNIIINSLGLGFFIAIFISLYLKEFLNFVMPVYLVYGIIAPMLSAVFITIFVLLNKQEKKRAERELWHGFEEDIK